MIIRAVIFVWSEERKISWVEKGVYHLIFHYLYFQKEEGQGKVNCFSCMDSQGGTGRATGHLITKEQMRGGRATHKGQNKKA
jgi:hypothetical protein